MFCEQCGQELRDDSRFCDGCGARILPKEERGPAIAAAAPPPPPPPSPAGAVFGGSGTANVSSGVVRQPDYLTQPMSVKDYLLFFLVMIIPFVNLIMLVKWSFIGEVNLNRRNLARASLIGVVVGILCSTFMAESMFQFFR